MTKTLRLAAILMAALFCLTAFAGCSDSSDSSSSAAESSEVSSEESSEAEETEESDAIIGKVTSVSDESFEVTVYESESEISDYGAIENGSLTATESTESITISDDVRFKYVSNGSVYTSLEEFVEVDDYVAVYTNSNGRQIIITLNYSEEADEAEDSDDSADSETSDEAEDSAVESETDDSAESEAESSAE